MKLEDKRIVGRMKKKYVQVKKMGEKWNTYAPVIGHTTTTLILICCLTIS